MFSRIRVLCMLAVLTCVVAASTASAEPPVLLDITWGICPNEGVTVTIFEGDVAVSEYILHIADTTTGQVHETVVYPSVPASHEIFADGGSYLAQAKGHDEFGEVICVSPLQTISPAESGEDGNPLPPANSRALSLHFDSLDSANFPFIYSVLEMGDIPQGCVLTPADFSVFEDDVLQTDYLQITLGGETGERLLDMVFIVDNSGSMSDEHAAVQANLAAFANGLEALGIDFRLGLVRFGQSANNGWPILVNNGSMTDSADDFINNYLNQNIASGGNEPGLVSTLTACNSYAFRPGSTRHFLLITDEDSNNPPGSVAETAGCCIPNGITVHAAALCSYGQSQAQYCGPGSIRDLTGGLLFQVEGPYDDIFDEITEDLISRAYVRYRTSNDVFDGVERLVRVELNACGEFAWDTATYTPGEAPTIVRTPETIALSDVPQIDSVPLTIACHVYDDYPPYVNAVRVFYRTSGSSGAYHELSMIAQGSDLWSAEVPGSAIQTPGLDYYISATDGIETVTDPPVDAYLLPHQIAVLPNEAPVIEHVPVVEWEEGIEIPISAIVTDHTQYVASVILQYRKLGDLIYQSVDMADEGLDVYTSEVPSHMVVTGGVQYRIRATDNYGVTTTAGPFTVSVTGDPECVVAALGDPVFDGYAMQLIVPIELVGVSGMTPITGVDVVFSFDPAILGSPIASFTGTLLQGLGWSFMWNEPVPGEFRIGLAGSEPLPGDGVLAYVILTVKPDAPCDGCSHLLLDVLLNEGDPCVDVLESPDWCLPMPVVTGLVNFWGCGMVGNDYPAIPDVRVELTGDSYNAEAWTDSTGIYFVEACLDSCYTLVPSKAGGEMLGISTLDAAVILRHVVGLDDLDACPISPMQMQDGSLCPESTVYPQQIAADVSGNGQITSYDASKILQYLVGADVSETLVGEWAFFCSERTVCVDGEIVSGMDFTGLLFGDVTGNYRFGGFREDAVPSGAHVQIVSVAASPGDVVDVPVLLSDADGFFGMTLDISHPEADAVVEGVLPGEMATGRLLEWRYEAGSLHVAMAGAMEMVGSGELMTIRYRIAEDVQAPAINLEVNGAYVDENPYPLSAEGGAITLDATGVEHVEAPSRFKLYHGAPSPFIFESRIAFDLRDPGWVVLSVYDVAGRRVSTLHSGNLAAGRHEYAWQGRNSSGQPVPAGTYFCKLQAGDHVETIRLTLIQ